MQFKAIESGHLLPDENPPETLAALKLLLQVLRTHEQFDSYREA